MLQERLRLCYNVGLQESVLLMIAKLRVRWQIATLMQSRRFKRGHILLLCARCRAEFDDGP